MKSNNAELLDFLQLNKADKSLIDMTEKFDSIMPSGVLFLDDSWNVIEWYKRPKNNKNITLDFSTINNKEVKLSIKIFFAEKRLLSKLDGSSIKAYFPALKYIDTALGARDFNKLSTVVFEGAEDLIKTNHTKSSPYRMAGYLQVFSDWISMNFGLRINYVNSLTSNFFHGRKATDSDREKNLYIHKLLLI